ncbi:MAG: Glycerol-3-phosphate dehydrogenase [NAD(P)+] [Alphaproteobacteria bacterium MarineAlpha4_Bin2]|nr:MAG: Glycerol-3-phosphate dehydrogenase [NAD(P)+] [Alphaproteobacteria bacterium MarineAlpha4_Bin2]
MAKITIIGSGAWGTALACVIRRNGHEAVMWVRETEVAESINKNRGNPLFLPGVQLEHDIIATTDLVASTTDADAILLVVPSQFLRRITEALAAGLKSAVPLVICAKGIEQGTCSLMTEVVEESTGNQPVAVLSGPTFAKEVAAGLPTAITLACADSIVGEGLIKLLGGERFRPYLSDDPIGAEIGGAVKNVLAIACGIVTGKKFGDNARAALITRGIAEMVRLGTAKGGKFETMMGLSGLGDLTLTCNGAQSRNMSLGMALGQGKILAEVLGERRSVAEGVDTSRSVVALAKNLGVEMPICDAVNRILHDDEDVDDVVQALLRRPFRVESAT